MGIDRFSSVTPINTGTRMLPADGTTAKSVGLATSLNRRYDSLLVSSTDTIPHVVEVLLLDGGTTTLLGTASIPAGQGYAATPSIDILPLVLPASQDGLPLKAVTNLQVRCVVAIQATFIMDFTLIGGYLAG